MLSGQHSTVSDNLCYLNVAGMSLADTTCKLETAVLSGHVALSWSRDYSVDRAVVNLTGGVT